MKRLFSLTQQLAYKDFELEQMKIRRLNDASTRDLSSKNLQGKLDDQKVRIRILHVCVTVIRKYLARRIEKLALLEEF